MNFKSFMGFLLLTGLFFGMSSQHLAAAESTIKTGWEQEWNSVLKEAKKEGVVSVYTHWNPEIKTALSENFAKKYGIKLEFTTFGRGAELAARVQKEKSAGLYAVDAFGTGAATMITTLKPMNLLGQIESFLMLPEVLNPDSWLGKRLFVDKAKTTMGMLSFIQRDIMYNTDLIQKSELTSYKDILKPQYRGKITMNDPTVTGTGNAMLSHLALHIWDVAETKAFLTQLIKQQDVVIQRDVRINTESVARGKLAVALAPHSTSLVQFMEAGAHVDVAVLKEGSYVNTAGGAIAVPTKVPHTNAAKVFLNWLLSREGQAVFSRSYGFPSRRTDVATAGFKPAFSAKPGERFFFENEEAYLFQGEMLKIAKEVVQQTIK